MINLSIRRSRSICTLSLLLAAAIPAARSRADITGFGNGNAYKLNSSSTFDGPSISNGVATLTTGGLQAHSIFNNKPQAIAGFDASFTYQESSTVATTGGGFAFVLENDPSGKSALGQSGAYLGYGGSAPISPSAAVEFNVTSVLNTTAAVSNTNFATNGALTGGINNLSVGANLGSGDNILINLNYNGSTLTETLTDTSTNGTPVTYSYNVGDLTSTLGSTAYVGFTGGTGALGSDQTISDFKFTAVPEFSAWGPTVGAALLVIAGARMWRKTHAGA